MVSRTGRREGLCVSMSQEALLDLLDSQNCEAVPTNFADAAKGGLSFAIRFQLDHGMRFAGFEWLRIAVRRGIAIALRTAWKEGRNHAGN